MTVRFFMLLLGPSIFLIFGIAATVLWAVERSRYYLLLLGGACLLFWLGIVSQIFMLPPHIGSNAMVSGAFHTAAVLVLCQALLMRSGKCASWPIGVALFAVFMGLLWLFAFIKPDLLARIYVQNFGYGVVLLVTALFLRELAAGRFIDRMLWWVFVAFAILFFPRTLLTTQAVPHSIDPFFESSFWQILQFALAVPGSILAMTILGAAMSDIYNDLRRERDLDVLTGLLNRRAFDERVSAQVARHRGASALILCDLDFFKRINDRYGHPAGDKVLRDLAALLSRTARKNDIVGRYGGEEFIIFLPGTSLGDAHECAERLRRAIAAHHFDLGAGDHIITASFGVAQLKPGENWIAVLERTDARLYAAKSSGRNHIISHDPVPHPDPQPLPLPANQAAIATGRAASNA
ncbi:GGDEF domain-containing protein [Pseudonocardia sp. TMWB2A]|uniref:GGDEF domain-containing protein n=1 Tax=Pseudonocardia sp. TMWB2A TaxID=687430 RepID=UPI00307F27A3